MGRPSNKPQDVWRYIDKRGEHECWPWIGAKSPRGYGVFGIGGEQFRVSRIICWLRDSATISLRAAENSAERDVVRHSCDNPGCCNPAHLSIGKPVDNTADMISRNRRANFDGENGGRAKLCYADVSRIREACRFGASQKDLARTYGVSVSTISTANSGRYYGHA